MSSRGWRSAPSRNAADKVGEAGLSNLTVAVWVTLETLTRGSQQTLPEPVAFSYVPG
jgi:hypothetical protein